MANFESLNQVQQAACHLIRSDLRLVYTVIRYINPNKSNYIPSLIPYLGVVIDGAEDWVKAVNKSNKIKLSILEFSDEEENFYKQIRESVKIWQNDYDTTYDIIHQIYCDSDYYFGNICKPIAKKLHLYDIYGVDTVNNIFCGNTILCGYYMPFFCYDENRGQYIKMMSEIGGEFIVLFNALKEYAIDGTLVFDTRDYGGFIKSPVGNKFSDKFILFSILCQINFILYCVGKWINEETPTKLRFAYLLYYSLLNIIPQINNKLGTNFTLTKQWDNYRFRNAMAHYKLGVDMKEKDLVFDDIMFGLTDCIFGEKYLVVKESIYSELEKLTTQISEFLKLKENCGSIT